MLAESTAFLALHPPQKGAVQVFLMALSNYTFLCMAIHGQFSERPHSLSEE